MLGEKRKKGKKEKGTYEENDRYTHFLAIEDLAELKPEFNIYLSLNPLPPTPEKVKENVFV